MSGETGRIQHLRSGRPHAPPHGAPIRVRGLLEEEPDAARNLRSDPLAALQFLVARTGNRVEGSEIAGQDLRRLFSDEPDAERVEQTREPARLRRVDRA